LVIMAGRDTHKAPKRPEYSLKGGRQRVGTGIHFVVMESRFDSGNVGLPDDPELDERVIRDESENNTHRRGVRHSGRMRGEPRTPSGLVSPEENGRLDGICPTGCGKIACMKELIMEMEVEGGRRSFRREAENDRRDAGATHGNTETSPLTKVKSVRGFTVAGAPAAKSRSEGTKAVKGQCRGGRSTQ
jgi:hypothetical protein